MASKFLSFHEKGLHGSPPPDSWTAMTLSILDNHHHNNNNNNNNSDDVYNNNDYDDDDENDDDDDETHFAAVTNDERVSSGWGIYDDLDDDN